MYKLVLLPLDGSALAEKALPHAVAQAENSRAELILLKVLEPLATHYNISLEAAERAEKATRELARDYLERIASGVREKGVSEAITFMAELGVLLLMMLAGGVLFVLPVTRAIGLHGGQKRAQGIE